MNKLTDKLKCLINGLISGHKITATGFDAIAYECTGCGNLVFKR